MKTNKKDRVIKKYYKKPENKAIIKVLNETGGLILPAGKRLKVADTTLRKWIKNSKELREAVVSAREKLIDEAEGALLKNVRAGKEASIFFLLKTQGKSRGYIENPQMQVNVNNGKIINYLPEKEEYIEAETEEDEGERLSLESDKETIDST